MNHSKEKTWKKYLKDKEDHKKKTPLGAKELFTIDKFLKRNADLEPEKKKKAPKSTFQDFKADFFLDGVNKISNHPKAK